MDKIDLTSHKILYKGFVGVEEYEFNYPEKNTSVKRTVVRRPAAVAILIVNKSTNSVILVRQFRAPVFTKDGDGFTYEIPAGVIDNNDTALNTVIRETLEETGFQIENPELLYSFYPTTGVLNERIHLYYVEVENAQKKEAGGGLDSETEYLEVIELSFEEVFAMLDKGEIVDAKTIIAIQYLKIIC